MSEADKKEDENVFELTTPIKRSGGAEISKVRLPDEIKYKHIEALTLHIQDDVLKISLRDFKPVIADLISLSESDVEEMTIKDLMPIVTRVLDFLGISLMG